MRNTLLTLLLLFSIATTNAQTLLTYGNNTVSKQEFVNAFYRNSNGEKPTEKAFRDYLELYIRYKLKVKAAYDMKLDTRPNQVAELSDFRNQISESYLNDQRTLKLLVDEAFIRSQKDIRVSHIYIPVDPLHPKDTAKAFKMAKDAYTELMKGTDFGNVAALYSADTSVRTTKGNIGWITAFTLPYEIESEIYALKPGQSSKPYHSKLGYHIFKNTGERNAVGRIRAAQILLIVPPGSTDAEKQQISERADSIYKAVSSGGPFNYLVSKYSGDMLTFQTNGELPEFGVGRYEGSFEDAVYSLTKPNEISKPILTSNGYHIVKLLERKPVNADSTNEEAMKPLKEKVQADSRIVIARNAALKRAVAATQIKTAPLNEKNLLIYSDSAFQGKKLPVLPGINGKTLLFTLPKKNVYVSDWLKYLRDVRNAPVLSEGKSMQDLLRQYKESVALEYYRNHLEEYDKEFARQLQEFKEGNMLFEVMQKNVWDKASADSIGLRQYYNANRNKYFWGPSADLLLFSSNDSAALFRVREQLAAGISNWRTAISGMETTLQADSGRYELNQLPVEIKPDAKAGYLTPTVKSSSDETMSFLYVIKIYGEKLPRNFEDAKGFVLNDYQSVLEEKWINELKKRYVVKVNQQVFQSLWQ